VSSGATGLAGRYAGALYALAVDSNKVDSIHDELGSLGAMLGESQDLKKLVESPILSRGSLTNRRSLQDGYLCRTIQFQGRSDHQ
jgi:F0F1-type ATP synthase delta subunit